MGGKKKINKAFLKQKGPNKWAFSLFFVYRVSYAVFFT